MKAERQDTASSVACEKTIKIGNHEDGTNITSVSLGKKHLNAHGLVYSNWGQGKPHS